MRLMRYAIICVVFGAMVAVVMQQFLGGELLLHLAVTIPAAFVGGVIPATIVGGKIGKNGSSKDNPRGNR